MFKTPEERKLIDVILAPGGGTQVSGDSGSGKSVFLLWLIITLCRWFRFPVLLIDPKGDLAKAAFRRLIKMQPSVRSRIRYYAPGNPDVPQCPLNPLGIDAPPGTPDYLRQSKLSCKATHTGHILLSNSGDEDFDLKPQLLKWMTLLIKAVGNLGMALADVRYFLNPVLPLYPVLTGALRDEFARGEFELLGSMRPDDRERVFASTKNRCMNAFDNPIIETHFGTIEVPSMRQAIEEGHIILVDLEARGNLREEDVAFLANAWLQEAFHTVFNTPEHERIPFFIIADELPLLKASFQLIASALRVIRGLQVRFIGAHQGTFAFPEGEDDPLLQTMNGQCGSHVIFRHHNEPEAQHFGRQLAIFDYDPLKVKFEHFDREQFFVRNEIITLHNASYSESNGGASAESDELGESSAANWTSAFSFGRSATDTESNAVTNSATQTHTDQHQRANGGSETGSTQETPTANEIRIGYGRAHAGAWNEVNGTTDGHSLANAKQRGASHADAQQVSGSRTSGGAITRNRMSSFSRTSNWTQSSGMTMAETLMPVYEWREVLRMKEFLTYDEQATSFAARIAGQTTGVAFFYVAGQGIEQVRVPMLPDPFDGIPRIGMARVAEFLKTLETIPGYYHYTHILAYRQKLIERLTAKFHRKPAADQGNDPYPK